MRWGWGVGGKPLMPAGKYEGTGWGWGRWQRTDVVLQTEEAGQGGAKSQSSGPAKSTP